MIEPLKKSISNIAEHCQNIARTLPNIINTLFHIVQRRKDCYI